jgi:hypothetical protein
MLPTRMATTDAPENVYEPPEEDMSARGAYMTCKYASICERLHDERGDGDVWDWCKCDECGEYLWMH